MEYLIVATVFALNFALWTIPMRKEAIQIITGGPLKSIATAVVCFFLMPYVVTLLCLKLLRLDTAILSNIMLVFVLLYTSIISLKKSLKNENIRRSN